MKTIAVIGGMGPQASLHAHARLLDKAIQANKTLNIVHVSLDIAHFYSSEPRLELTKKQKEILNNIQADIGFISCNTAHIFFQQIQNEVRFQLVHIYKDIVIPDGSKVLCSQTSSDVKLFGSKVVYPSRVTQQKLNKKIVEINNGQDSTLMDIDGVFEGGKDTLVFGCTELSMIAYQEGIKGLDTLEVTLDSIVSTL